VSTYPEDLSAVEIIEKGSLSMSQKQIHLLSPLFLAT
jgi:hypothetical protein